MPSIDDDVLWQNARAGDAEAFGELFERRVRIVFAYCFRRTGDRYLAEDLVSITFLQAWRRRDVNLPPGKVLPFLLGIASNVLRNQTRALRRYRAALDRLPRGADTRDLADDVTNKVGAEQRMHEITKQLRSLPRSEQEVLALVIWQGLTPAEAAFALGIAEGTVRSRLFRVRARLREFEEAQPKLIAQSLKGADS
jgi:RNA polymerase sigma factor (sigma-70 family)